MRQIFLLDRPPCFATLSWCQFRLVVDDVLELINRNAVWKERDASCEVIEFVFRRLFTEEFFHPWISKELHRHRMNLARFIRREGTLWSSQVTALIDLERMSDFVCQDIDVACRSIEVREDEREFFVCDVGTIPTARFSRLRR